ncbi:MAG TPA: endolytic transglycosylase MltG [Gallionellaceae bacterium]|nr:endolytic transglycosylase MltG [Gallionellaceae bacterium]
MRRLKRLTALILLVVLGLAAGSVAVYVTRPLALPSQPFSFSLTQGESVRGAARQLQAAGLLKNERDFVWLARVTGKSGAIKAGNYELDAPISTWGLLNMLAKGRVSQGEIRIVEGWMFSDFRKAVNENPGLLHDTRNLTDAEILQRIGAPEKDAEGLFFPDKYYFPKGASDLVIYRRAYQTMQRHLAESWKNRAPDLPLETPYEALTLASIVEKETGQAKDRTMIAGVFINRLRKGMRLQTDPAVIYGIRAKFDGNLRKRDLLRDTPYNTYTRAGLTPTPIALPGLASIQAVLHPAKTNALYFVARGDGSSEFSDTLAKHNRAVDKYQLHQ